MHKMNSNPEFFYDRTDVYNDQIKYKEEDPLSNINVTKGMYFVEVLKAINSVIGTTNQSVQDLISQIGNIETGWNIPGVAFIDPSVNSGQGTIGDGNDPFSTHAAAVAAGATSFILLPGNYSEQFDLKSGASYYSYEGVTFVNGGITATTNQVGTKWLGYADFIGNFEMIYFNDFLDLVDVEIEFNEIEETGTSARGLTLKVADAAGNLSNVNIRGRKFVGLGGNAYGIYIRGRLGGSISIDEIYGDYSTIDAFQHENSTLVISYNKLVLRDGGAGGNLAQYKQAFISYTSDADSNITLKGDIYNEVSSLMGSNGATVTTWSGSLGTIIIEGDIYSNNNRGIYNTGGNIIHRGSIESLDKAYEVTAGKINSNGNILEQGVSSTVSGTGKLEIGNSIVKSSTSDHIIDVVGNTAELRITNSILEGTSGLCVEHNGGTSTIAFQGSVASNLANSALTDACSPTGFTQQTGLVALY